MVKIVSTCYAGGEISTQTKTVEKETDYSRVESCVVNIYPDAEYQTLLGFGGAVTEAAGYVYQSLNEESRKKVGNLLPRTSRLRASTPSFGMRKG